MEIMKKFIKKNKAILIVIARIIVLFGVLFTLAKRYNIGILGQFLITALIVLWSVLDVLEHRG